MEDYEYKARLARNVGANIILLLAMIFLLGGIILNDGIFGQIFIRISILATGVLLLIAGVAMRFSKVSTEYEYA